MDKFKTAFEQEQDLIFKLWNKHLANDKRSFIEYFIEEHNIIIDEYTSYETLKSLCDEYIVDKKSNVIQLKGFDKKRLTKSEIVKEVRKAKKELKICFETNLIDERDRAINSAYFLLEKIIRDA